MKKYRGIVYILRGVSGSGKSTFTKTLPKNRVVHSTDNYFYKGGKYRFDPRKLTFYHRKNFEAFVESLKKGKKIVVVDNTNLLCKFVAPYLEKAREFNYRVILVEFLPRGREYHIRKNVHNIPPRAISTQMKEFYQCLGKIEADKIIRKRIQPKLGRKSPPPLKRKKLKVRASNPHILRKNRREMF
jgi:predicted kinase